MDARSQGGVKVPTGGDGEGPEARERLRRVPEGQQIRCNPGADGHSPDERERGGGLRQLAQMMGLALVLAVPSVALGSGG